MTEEELNELIDELACVIEYLYNVCQDGKCETVDKAGKALTEYRDSMGFDVLQCMRDKKDFTDKTTGYVYRYVKNSDNYYVNGNCAGPKPTLNVLLYGDLQPYTPPITDMLEDEEWYLCEEVNTMERLPLRWNKKCEYFEHGNMIYSPKGFEPILRDGKPIKITTD